MFARTDEHQIVADNLRKFLRAANPSEQRRERLKDRSAAARLALWPGLADLGILGAGFREDIGGLAGDARTIAVVLAELGTSLALEPFLDCGVIAGQIVQHWSDEQAKVSMARRIFAGEHIVVLAHDAPVDPFRPPAILARRNGKECLLTGTVRCVHNADLAHEYLITAADGGLTTIFRLPADTGGLTLEPYRLMDDSCAADLHLQDVRLPSTSEMHFDVPAQQVLEAATEVGALGVAAESAAIVNVLNRDTFHYLMTRKQFGAPIGTFQALQHRAANMYMAARGLESTVDLALDAMEAAPSPARSSCVSAAKTEADRASSLIGHEAIQLHGGMGVSDELIISHYGRRLATIRMKLGDADVHKLRFGGL